jgi:hypothetical protein
MKEKRTVVVTLRLPQSIGDAAQRLADKDRRKLSSFLALIVEDGIKAMLEADRPDKAGKGTRGKP